MTGFVSRRPGEIDEVALSPGQGCECPGDIHTSQWGLVETRRDILSRDPGLRRDDEEVNHAHHPFIWLMSSTAIVPRPRK